jgi:hypothetical protein
MVKLKSPLPNCTKSSMTAFASSPATGAQVTLYSRPGNDLTHRFPLIVETLARLRSRSCIIDGEAVACDDNGVASFNLIRYRRHDDSTFVYAFDLIELNGDDLRRDPLEVRKATLASIVAKASPGIRFNEHREGEGPTVFAYACKMGLEGIDIVEFRTAAGEALAISIPRSGGSVLLRGHAERISATRKRVIDGPD